MLILVIILILVGVAIGATIENYILLEKKGYTKVHVQKWEPNVQTQTHNIIDLTANVDEPWIAPCDRAVVTPHLQDELIRILASDMKQYVEFDFYDDAPTCRVIGNARLKVVEPRWR